MIFEKAYAKINLALEVLDVVNGYHKVNNIMVPITLFDELTFEESDKVFVENDNIINNIIIKAANLFLDYYKISSGVKITLNKNIPLEAGLAGGSSDAAATLRGLNKLFNVNASKEELKQLATSLGSDVPFFIEEKPALCTGRGEIINLIESNISGTKIELFKIPSGLSTKEVYQNYIYNNISKNDKINNLLEGIKNNNIKLIKDNIFNDLALVALSLNDELKYAYDKLSKNNNIYISGSGPTMYSIEESLNIADINGFHIKCEIK